MYFLFIVLTFLWHTFFYSSAALAEDLPALHVGIEKNYPPFSYADSQGKPTGFDFDFALALCAILNRPCEIHVLPLAELLTMQNGTLDLCVAGMSITEERKVHMDFSAHYYRSRTLFIGENGIHLTNAWMHGKRLGVQHKTVQSKYAQAMWSEILTVVQYPTLATAYQKLIDKEVDFLLVDGPPAYDFLKSPQGKQFTILFPEKFPELPYSSAHIGVRKETPELLQSINKAIEILRFNRTYEDICAHYFSYSIY